MNKGINKVILIGHLGGDPDLKYTPGGQVVATFSVATKEVWKDKDGCWRERVELHRCVVWNKLAEIAAEYLKKGSLAYFEGKLQTRDWTDKKGVKRYTTEIVVRDIQVLNHKSNGVAPDVPPLSDEITLLPKRNGGKDLPFKFMLQSIITPLNHPIERYNMVLIPCQADAAVSCQLLLRLEGMGQQEYIVEGIEKPVSVQKLLNGVENPQQRTAQKENEFDLQKYQQRIDRRIKTMEEKLEKQVQDKPPQNQRTSFVQPAILGIIWWGVIIATIFFFIKNNIPAPYLIFTFISFIFVFLMVVIVALFDFEKIKEEGFIKVLEMVFQKVLGLDWLGNLISELKK